MIHLPLFFYSTYDCMSVGVVCMCVCSFFFFILFHFEGWGIINSMSSMFAAYQNFELRICMQPISFLSLGLKYFKDGARFNN